MFIPRYPVAHPVKIVGLGPAGRTVINLLVPVSPSPRIHVAVARDRKALAECDAGERLLLRHENLPDDVMELRRVLNGAELVMIVGSTSENLTRLILDIVKTQGSAVVRIVATATTEDPRYGIDHMLDEMIREIHAWLAGTSARQAQLPDVTPSS